MNKEILRKIWISACLLTLGFVLYGYDGKPNSDIGVVLAWVMMAFSFPLGLIVPAAHAFLDDAFGISFNTSYLSLVSDWLAFFVFGYAQWFAIIPRISAALHQRKSN